ncbi:peptide methionine sulfoxide reductase [Cohnella kolymensis]|uniref:Peptide methionine sulfoxide reductase MsrA n=1 Tax=Cohnella kolymensis TaxID=1590652 RepID=A0ABR5A9B4_9BACL|nr:peptide-methionine (S)-S-oxide reductase MsrA [Cohnella kolymensis]KIL37634.1 peptide methionine sulfoxide reductase [Cohnella kolymensis]
MNNGITIEPSFTQNFQTVTLGMGCFWSPDALFGHLPGVVRTRVGYAGGTAANPTYRDMGDHSETVEIDYDPSMISLKEILNVFWSNHNPININGYKGKQYMSLILYRDKNQNEPIQQVKQRQEQEKGKLETRVEPYSGFYLAEDRHQKHYLKRYPNAIEKISTLYPSEEGLTNSTLASRLNGLAKGYTNLEQIKNEINQWPTSLHNREMMVNLIKQIRW